MSLDPENPNAFKSLIYKEGRPKRNSHFLVFLFAVGVVGVITFAILAVTTQNSRASCPCQNPYKQIGYERILDLSECQKDNQWKTCSEKKIQQWTMFTGLAGGSGGLLMLTLLLLRCG
ncbi:hypothetical protein Rsub_02724 [Raphidocelis subcapitata]|uniref:Uncharacterized protein n=1 Tax=Raphidocelis subcapitata TaxID=307507 RepID=A0A2V0NQS2_9CHLO|nr:hypothetical protein Rsub_02724 [Raphidocelis subcapitata]|eukprot:GBF90018.1 hypothetical protein Rsub_02724 [Raphidocelis subcapitata]